MAEEDKSTSAWYKVPTWDGSPASWRAFQREMNWWLSSLDVESTKKFNLAARWLLRQGGVVRQRGEEFAPEDLVYQKEVRAKDTDGVEIVVTKEDPFAGINKLLKALEGINGKSALDRKGELRNQFYLTLRRSPGERPADFLSRFRVLTAEMRSEGIDLPTGELGWFLREKLGLDPLRKQLLETALQGREKFEDVEAEALRLFKDLHASDPLFRKLGQEARGRGRGFAGSSSSSGASSLRSSGGSTWQSRTGSSIGTASAGAKAAGQGGPFQNRRPFFGNFRAKQAYAAEAEDETAEDTYEPEEEELLADEPAEPPNLDEVLEIEAEALAAELEQAENEGVDPSMLEQVEGCVETAAEALITMRDAKTRLQEVRRDRGYGRAGGNSGGQGQRPPPPFKKRGVCHDCGLPGHWAGDAGCARPGAGLAKPKPRKDAGRGGGSPSSSPPSGSPHRRVQVVETFAAEAGQEQDHEDQKVNETAVPSTLQQALEMTCPQEVLAGAMASDKRNAGALDSACNRTVCGRMWLESYIADLRASPCWKALQPLLATEAEKETFKFGNDGTKASMERYRIPVTIGDTVVCVWTSVVEVRSLGLLLGRDFLEAIGGVISFTRRALRADHLDCRRIPLRQLSAGHFYLELLPKDFSEDLGRRWTRQGADGVLEVQVSCAEWARRRAAAVKPNRQLHVHEQLASEASSVHVRGDLSRSKASAGDSIRCVRSLPHVGRSGRGPSRSGMEPVSSYVPATPRKKRVALRWASALAAAATLASLCAPAVQQHPLFGRVEGTGGGHGETGCLASPALPDGAHAGQVRRRGAHEGCWLPAGQAGDQARLFGGPDAPRHARRKVHKGSESSHPEPDGRSLAEGGGREESQGRRVDGGTVAAGTKRGFALFEAGPASFGRPVARRGPVQRHRRQTEGQAASHGGYAPWYTPFGDGRDNDRGDLIENSFAGRLGKYRGSSRARAGCSRRFAGTSPTTSSTGTSLGWANGDQLGRQCSPPVAGAGHAGSPGPKNDDDAGPGNATCDDDDPTASRWGTSPVATGQRHGLSDGRPRPVIAPLRQHLKAGQRLLINEAWRKGKRDRQHVNVSPQELWDAMAVTVAEDYDRALNAPFVAFPPESQVTHASFGAKVVQAARAKGHAVTMLRGHSGPYFLLLRAAGASPLLNLRPATRRAAEKKTLVAEARAMQQALAHRRSGRHFLMELLRSADPRRTLEGQELLDEPGVADFSLNGCRYLTSSAAVVQAFRDGAGGPEAGAVLEAMEKQFEDDHRTEGVSEAMAAETDLESEFAAGGYGSDSEDGVEEREPVKDVPVSAAVRQAVRRLHENTGHRSPKRLARALVIAGAPPEAVIAAKQLRCSVCEEKRPPRIQRPFGGDATGIRHSAA